MSRCYIYYTHTDGDRMILTAFDDYQPDPSKPPAMARFTPHHKITSIRGPLLFPTHEQAEQWIADYGYLVPETLRVVNHLSMDHLKRIRKYHEGV